VPDGKLHPRTRRRGRRGNFVQLATDFVFKTRGERLPKSCILHGGTYRFQGLQSASAVGATLKMASKFRGVRRVQLAVKIGVQEGTGLITGHGQPPWFRVG